MFRSASNSSRASDRIPEPAVWNACYRQLVEPWRQHYGHRLTIIPFQKSAFPEGLVNNLFRRFFPDFAHDLPDFDCQQANQSEPGEVSCLMQTYFRVCYPDEAREFRADAGRLRHRLMRAATEAGLNRKAKVKPQVATTILSNHSKDLVWLATEEKIVFDDLYNAANTNLAPIEPRNGPFLMSDVIEVNTDDVQTLVAHAAKQEMMKIVELERKLRHIRQSWSWRLTAPLRKLVILCRRLLGKAPSSRSGTVGRGLG